MIIWPESTGASGFLILDDLPFFCFRNASILFDKLSGIVARLAFFPLLRKLPQTPQQQAERKVKSIRDRAPWLERWWFWWCWCCWCWWWRWRWRWTWRWRRGWGDDDTSHNMDWLEPGCKSVWSRNSTTWLETSQSKRECSKDNPHNNSSNSSTRWMATQDYEAFGCWIGDPIL